MAGRETIAGAPGPMTTDREALEIFMEVAVSAEPWNIDPSLTVKEWTPYKFSKPPKIAIQWWDGVVMPHPPMIRALREVADACRKAGFEVVDWDCEGLDHAKGWEILMGLYWPDGGKEVRDLIEGAGEPMLPLTEWIINEGGNKELTQAELWKVSRTAKHNLKSTAANRERTIVMSRARCLPSTIRRGMEKHRKRK